MSLLKTLKVADSDRGVRAALLFALVAERLTTYYEHGVWLKEGQGATLAVDWLARSGRGLSGEEVRSLSKTSDALARQIEASLSRQAGLYAAHEMTESLDPNYQSETGRSLMEECGRVIAELMADGQMPDRGVNG